MRKRWKSTTGFMVLQFSICGNQLGILLDIIFLAICNLDSGNTKRCLNLSNAFECNEHKVLLHNYISMGFMVKVKMAKLSLCLTKHHTIKMYRGSGGIPPHILDICTRWR
jgi:hypothetical protein